MAESVTTSEAHDTRRQALKDGPTPSLPASDHSGSRPSENGLLSLWERFSFSAVHGFNALLLRIFGVRGLYRLAQAFGTLEWLINYSRRRRFARALEKVMPTAPSTRQRREWTRRNFVQTRCDKLFYLIFDCIPRERARQLFSIDNQNLLDKAVGHGRGVYVATSHHGSMHIAGLMMAVLGYKVAGVRERHESGLRRYVQQRLDEKHPEFRRAKVLYTDSYPREIFRCLQEGYVLGSSMDVNRTYHPNQRTEAVTVFGQERQFLSGPLRIAYRCGVPALQGFIVPESGFRYRFEMVEELFGTAHDQPEDEAVAYAMQRYAANVERFIRAAPYLMSKA